MRKFYLLPFCSTFCFLFLVSARSLSQYNCIDSSLTFNGENKYVKLAPNDISGNNFLSMLTDDYTIECLIKWNGGADYQRIFDFSFGSGYFMFLTPSENSLHVPRFAISTTGLNAPQIVDATIGLSQNIYHHIAVTYSKAQSMVNIFIDGIKVGSGTVTIDADSIYVGTDMHNSSNNYIGLSSFAGDPQLNADLDEFRISNIVRYTDNFTLTVPFTPDNNTVALYHFNEGSGQIGSDTSGNDYTAQLGSGPNEDDQDPSWISCQDVLAATLTSFTATNIKNKIQLNWISQENDIHYFEIQRSTDGVHFSTINKLMSRPGINNNYTYTDAAPAPGKNYYRLNIVDRAGANSYSQYLLAVVNKNDLFKIYPTFTSGKMHISVSQEPSTIVIYNTMGATVKKIVLTGNEYNIDVSSLPAGNYIMHNVTLNASIKFIKQ